MDVLGVERRRRWTDAAKLGILAEVNTNGWKLAEVARRHDLTRQQLYPSICIPAPLSMASRVALKGFVV